MIVVLVVKVYTPLINVLKAQYPETYKKHDKGENGVSSNTRTSFPWQAAHIISTCTKLMGPVSLRYNSNDVNHEGQGSTVRNGPT